MSEFFRVLGEVLNLQNLLMINIGVAVGTIVGAMPGLNKLIGITLLLPFTYKLDSLPAIMLLLGCYCAGSYGGSITAILINTPGTGAAMPTMIDGYPMAQQGRAGDALKAALVASTFGGIFSAACLAFLAPVISAFAKNFHSADYFSLCLFGLFLVVSISGENVLKGLLMAGLGLLISTVGIDTMDGISRFMFGRVELLAGIPSICVMMGAFAVGNCYLKCFKRENSTMEMGVEYKKSTISSFRLIKENFFLLLRSSAIGAFIGAVPGTGGAIASYIGYNVQVSSAKSDEERKSYGKGNIKGVLAPESANNGVCGATLIPMLTLGIPGDNAVAVMGAALMLHGITPGPALFTENRFWVYCLMVGLFIVNIFMLAQGAAFVRAFANVARVPMTIMIPCIFIICTVGGFTSRQYLFDLIIVFAFSVLGYVLRRCGYPLQPMTIGIVLGSLCERNLRRALVISEGSISIFFTRPISLVLLIVSFLSLFWPTIKRQINKRKKNKQNAAAQAG